MFKLGTLVRALTSCFAPVVYKSGRQDLPPSNRRLRKLERRVGDGVGRFLKFSFADHKRTAGTVSEQKRLTYKNAARRALARSGFQFDILEPRTLFSVYHIAGSNSVNQGSAYTLSLSSDSTTIQSWNINWGDGTAQSPDIQLVSGNPSTVQHTYATGGNTSLISATATDASGTHEATPALSGSYPVLTAGSAGVQSILAGADDDTDTIDLGSNNFRLYGTNYTGATALNVSSNGMITFPTDDNDFENANFNDNPDQAAIAPLWKDLTLQQGPSAVLYRFDDTNGDGISDRLIVQWNDASPYGDDSTSATFQAVLQLNTGNQDGQVIFNYVSIPQDYFNSATVGVKSPGSSGNPQNVISYNQVPSWAGADPLVNTAIDAHAGVSVAVTAIPTATVSGTPIANNAIPYTLNLSTSGLGGATVNSWTINWGDGTTQTPDLQTITGNPSSIQHTYTTNDSRIVTATANTTSGNLSTNNLPINVLSQLPVDPYSGSPIPQGAQSSSIVLATINDSFEDDGPSAYQITIDWGDGSVLDSSGTVVGDNLFGSDGSLVEGSHQYASTGIFQAVVTVTRLSDGNMITVDSTVTVQNGSLIGFTEYPGGAPLIDNDDATWIFNANQAPFVVDRIAANGSQIQVVLNANETAGGMHLDSNGGLWLTGFSGTSREMIHIDATGSVLRVPIPTNVFNVNYFSVDASGNAWFSEGAGNKIAKVSINGTLTEYATSETPDQINYSIPPLIDNSGGVWFTENTNKIGHIDPAGTLFEYTLPTANSFPSNLTVGANGEIWLNESSQKIAKISSTGNITEFSVAGAVSLRPRSDGSLWFVDPVTRSIGIINSSGILNEHAVPTPNANPGSLVFDSSGNAWFTEGNVGQIGRISQNGMIIEYSVGSSGSGLGSLVIDNLGNAWFAEANAGKIGEINVQTNSVTEYSIPTPDSEPSELTIDSAGNAWFLESTGSKVGEVTHDGHLIEYLIPTPNTYPQNLSLVNVGTVGAGGIIWFTESTTFLLGRFLLNKGVFANSVATQSESSQTLGYFNDEDLNATAGNYTVTINWGDGSASTIGTVIASADPTYRFEVLGSHTYASQGNYIPIVTISDDGGASTQIVSSISVSPLISVEGAGVATEGNPYAINLSSAGLGADSISSWTINWGDGTTANPDLQTVSGITSAVTHNYASSGAYVISASATEQGGTYTAPSLNLQVNNSAGLPTLVLQGVPETFLRGVAPGPTALASIDDIYDDGDTSAYTAVVDWGDGTPLDNTATVEWNDQAGGFVVVGSHAYTSAGSFTPTITVTHIDDGNSAVVQGAATVVGLQATTNNTSNQVQLSYGYVFGETLELEEAGPGDLNYHVVTGFVPDYSAGEHIVNVTGLQGDSHYQFRLKSVINGQVQYFSTFANTTSSNDSVSLAAPQSSSLGSTNAESQTPLKFQWSEEPQNGFTVTVWTYSSAEPLSLFNAADSVQTFSIPSNDYTPNGFYTLLPTLPANADEIEFQISDGTNITPWTSLTTGTAVPADTGPSRTLSSSLNTNGSATFTVNAGTSVELYGITTTNQLVALGTVSSSVPLTLSTIPTSVQAVIAFDGTNYSNTLLVAGTAPSVTAAPTNLIATSSENSTGPHQVRLVWDDNANNESGYAIQRLDLSVASAAWQSIGVVPADQTSYSDTVPDATHLYEYRVVAVNANVDSSPSNTTLVWFAPNVSAIGINPASTAVAGNPITFSASAAPEVNTEHALTYSWSLSNTTLGGSATIITTTTPVLTFTPPTAGNWTANLTVTDAVLALSTTVISKAVNVGEAPVIQVTGTGVIAEGQLATYSATGTAVSNITWSVTHNGAVVATGSGSQFSFVPTTSGAYAVQAQGLDSSNASHSAQTNLTVSYIPPTVSISGEPIGFVGRAMTFGSNITQPIGTNSSLTYQWQVVNSDGSLYSIPASDPTTLSTFTATGSLTNGTYSVRLTVTDESNSDAQIVREYQFSILPLPSTSDEQWGTGTTAPDLTYGSVAHGNAGNDAIAGITGPTVVAQQPDGKILVAGELASEGIFTPFIARFNPDMTIDTTFGNNGWGFSTPTLIPTQSFNGDVLEDVAIRQMTFDSINGDIVVVGDVHDLLGTPEAFVEEYVSNATVMPDGTIATPGMPDLRFNNGQPRIFTGTASTATAISILANGSLLIGGTSLTTRSSGGTIVDDFFVAKLTSQGQLDTTFNENGIAQASGVSGVASNQSFSQTLTGLPNGKSSNFPYFSAELSTLTVLSNGQIVVAGYASRYADNDDSQDTGFTLVRYNSNGTIDNNFGTNGVAFTSSSTFNQQNTTYDCLSAIEVLPTGEILAAGVESWWGSASEWDGENAGNPHIVLAKYTADGQLDVGYGSSGIIQTTITGGSIALFAEANNEFLFRPAFFGMTFDANGELDVSAMINDGSDFGHWSLMRISPTTGNLDTSFGATGTGEVVVENGIQLASASNHVTGVLWTPTGVIGVGMFDGWKPVAVRYSPSPDMKVSGLEASSADGAVDLTWQNTGFGQNGFQVERSTTLAGLGASSSLIATVGAAQDNFVDTTASAGVTYFYRIVPFTTSSDGTTNIGTTTSTSLLTTQPLNSTNVLQEELSVPTTGNSITSQTILQAGQAYIIIASGTLGIGAASLADAAYWYSATEESDRGQTLSNSPYGIAVSTSGGALSVPDWGAYDGDNHTYTYTIIGQGQPLSVTLSDANLLTGDIHASGQPLQIAIYAVNPSNGTSSTQNLPVLQIESPTPASGSVLSTNTSVSIVAANANGSNTPWALWLVSASGQRTLVASGENSVGSLPNVGTQVASINPTTLANGLYTLQLSSSITDPADTVVDSRTFAISTVVKTGNLQLPVTDGTINIPDGSVSITRTYDSSKVGQAGDFGSGWSLNLIDSQLTVVGHPDTLNPSQTTPVLKAGDLVYMSVPDDGAHVFEFVPTPAGTGALVSGSSTGMSYVPTFVALDGSGATLTISGLAQFGSFTYLTYDPVSNQFIGVGNELGFNPARESDLRYKLTTKDGTSYTINPSTGLIESLTDTNGHTTTYTTDSSGNVTARDQASNKILFTINKTNGRVTSIAAPGQPAILYKYDSSGRLTTVQMQSGDKDYYAYQDLTHPGYLTGVTNSQGETVLQASYDSSSGLLATLTNAEGVVTPVPTFALGSNEVIQTVVNAAGDITQNVYDEKYGNLLRKIQSVMDATGQHVQDYIVTVNDYAYVQNDVAQTSALQNTNEMLLESLTTYASFEILGTDDAGIRYSLLPNANSWTQHVELDTGGNVNHLAWNNNVDPPTDVSIGLPLSISKQLTIDGIVQTTTYANFVIVDYATLLARATVIKTEIQTPDSESDTGYDTNLQSATYTSYDQYGRLLYSLTTIGNNPNVPGSTLLTGTQNIYGGDTGQMIGTQNVSASVDASGNISFISTSSQLTTNSYYDTTGTSDPAPVTPPPVTPPTAVAPGSPPTVTVLPMTGSTQASLETITGAVLGQVKFSIDAAGQETYYAYDAAGRPLLQYEFKQWTDSNGQPVSGWVGTTTTYNQLGQVTDVYQNTYLDNAGLTDGNGHHVLNVIAGAGQVEVGEDSVSSVHTVHNDYNAAGQKINSVDQYGGTTTYTYDGQGNLLRTVNPDGTEVRNVYDALNRVIWTSQTFVSTNSDPSSAANTAVLTHTIYNQLGQVVETDQVQGGTIEITTIQNGSSLIWTSQEVGGVIFSTSKTFFDPAGNAIEIVAPSGLRTGTIYNPDGTVAYTGPLTASAPDGGHTQIVDGVTTAAYSVSDFASYTHTLYNQFNATLYIQSNGVVGFYTRVIDQDGHVTDTYKDSQGRTVRTAYDDGSFTEILYSIGNQPVTKDQEGDTIATPTSGWNNIASGGYEKVTIGQRESGDPLIITYNLYNADNELTDVWQPAVVDAGPNPITHGQSVEPLTTYGYDTAGNNITQTDANGNTTTFVYDQNGNMVRETLPELKSNGQPNYETWTYNALDEVTSHVDFDGQTTAYTYLNTTSGQGKPLTEYFFNSGISAFDSNGNTLTANAAESTTVYYNTLGQRAETDDYINGILNRQTLYTYDVLTQQLASVTTPEGTISYTYVPATGLLASTSTVYTSTSYGYDAQGRLTTVTVTKLNGQTLTTPLVTTYGYDAAGNKTAEFLPNGLFTGYIYDGLNRLTLLVTQMNSQPYLVDQYTLNDDGTRQSVNEVQLQSDGSTTESTTEWTYDADGRLTSETANGTTDTYTYDQAGNRIKWVHQVASGSGSETITYSYNSDDELVSQTSSLSGTTTFAYDAGGSLTSETNGSMVTAYTYNVRGKLATASVNGIQVASYVYDDSGNRIAEITLAGTSYYHVDPNTPFFLSEPLETESALDGAPMLTYLIGDRVYGQVNANGTAGYMLVDGHGNTKLLVGSTDQVIAVFDYTAFGDAVGFNPATAPTIFLFGGDAMYDPSTGLYIHGDGIRARLGFFFIQKDSYVGNTQDPSSLHKYLYAEADAVNLSDPSGHDILGGTLLAIAGGVALDTSALVVSGGGALAVVSEVIAEGQGEALIEDGAMLETELTTESGIVLSDAFDIAEEYASNVQQIVTHLGRLEGALEDPPNAAMLNRISTGLSSFQDLNFYTHELMESNLMSQGLSYAAAHAQTLASQGIAYVPGYEAALYDPEVIAAFLTYFNPAAWPTG